MRFAERSCAAIEGWIVLATGLHDEAQEDDVHEAFAEYGEARFLLSLLFLLCSARCAGEESAHEPGPAYGLREGLRAGRVCAAQGG
jgi:hypothetical protein